MAEPWHLDRRVPLALIITIVVQTGGLIWWAASMTKEVEQQGQRLGALETSRDAAATLIAGMRADTAVLRAEADATRRQLDRIERLLERRADATDLPR